MDIVPPILKEFPHSFETERLLIRLPLPGDGVYINQAIIESLEHLRPWMQWANRTPSLDETEINVRQAYCHFLERVDLRFHLFEKRSKRFIGSSGLHRIDWSVPKFEIGYWCRKSEMGKGLITEGVRGLTVFAFEILGAKRVEIRCDERNIRSRKVAERLGYQLEGILRNFRLAVDDHIENTCIYSMTPDDFKQQTLQQRSGASQ
ncbi:GNAT family N-acetyltransferase [Thermoflavimicrobium daqui]|uniref:GNAT family N-acetyltransferase n=1 Tax=Thermoflavimicrobium daqui TaxID=2137476 RepID=A0A364K6P8_9BACL|nr:GNAT family N-acetyltransferase [Thermoflavimicrobium daqui]RAL25882.1 GNAT family N-acetyltransferase [Thermoflavimicrobium daqui]